MAPGMDQLEIELQSDGEVVDTAIIGIINVYLTALFLLLLRCLPKIYFRSMCVLSRPNA